MKILVVGHSIAHYRQRKMWEWMADQGHKVLAICVPEYAGEVYSPITQGSYKLELLNIYKTQMMNGWYFPQMMDVIAGFEPDILFCVQEPTTYCAYNIASIAKLLKLPFGFFTWENIRKTYPYPWRQMYREIINSSSLVIGGNKDACEIMMEAGADVVYQIPQTGLDKELFVPEPRLQYDGKIPEKKKLLFVGRLVKEKGIEVILKVFDKLNDDYLLRFVGGRGNMDAVIKQHPEYGKRISLEEWKEYKELPKVYNWADLTLVPSIDTAQWIEQFGYVVGESLLCHTPALVSASKTLMELWALPDVTFAPQEDVDMLVAGIGGLIDGPRAKKGRQAVIKTYSVEAVGKEYLKAFKEIV